MFIYNLHRPDIAHDDSCKCARKCLFHISNLSRHPVCFFEGVNDDTRVCEPGIIDSELESEVQSIQFHREPAWAQPIEYDGT